MDPIIVKTEANLEMLVKSEKITSELFAHLKEEIKASIATGVPTVSPCVPDHLLHKERLIRESFTGYKGP